MLLQTHDRIYRLIKSEALGKDPIADKYIKDDDDITYKACAAIRQQSVRRSYVEACLLATSDHSEIATILEMPKEIISLYAKIYYNLENWDRLSKMSLIDEAANETERTLKLWSLSQGISFIAWRLGHRVTIPAVDGLTDLFNDCIFKSKEALFSNNAATSSKESVKWVRLSMDIGKLLKSWVSDSAAATRDIELALKEVVPNFTTFEEINDHNNDTKLIDTSFTTSVEIPSVEELNGK